MQNESRRKSASAATCRRFFVAAACFVSCSALADLKDRQSFRPVEWESDFVSENSLSIGAFALTPGAKIVELQGQNVYAAYGLQLTQYLRDDWNGRVGLHLGRTGPRQGQYVWTFISSDLQRPLIPESLYQSGPFRFFRPLISFGLGGVSRWQNSGMGLNVVPTLRYELSEPVAHVGTQLLFPFSDELIFSIEYRFLQSARVSRHRGSTWGASLIWGKIN